MPRHFKIDDVLTDEEHAELSAIIRKRSSTVDQAWTWLREHGHKVSRGAAHNWMRKQREIMESPTAELRGQLLKMMQKLPDEQVRAAIEFLSRL